MRCIEWIIAVCTDIDAAFMVLVSRMFLRMRWNSVVGFGCVAMLSPRFIPRAIAFIVVFFMGHRSSKLYVAVLILRDVGRRERMRVAAGGIVEVLA